MPRLTQQRRIYSQQIDPLLSQVRDLCNKHGFDFLGLVTIPVGAEDHQLFGISNLDIDRSPGQLLLARDCAQENFDRVAGVIETHRKMQVGEYVPGPLDK